IKKYNWFCKFKVVDEILVKETNNSFIQFFRYGLVAVIIAVFDFSTLFVLTEFLNIYYLISVTSAYLVGFFANYLFCIFWVFRSHYTENRFVELLTISFVGMVGMVLTILLVWFFTEKIGFYYILSKFVAIFIVFMWNFSARKYIVFR
ncbi:GtrA family protein, partial [Patescibacteria group bacterium]